VNRTSFNRGGKKEVTAPPRQGRVGGGGSRFLLSRKENELRKEGEGSKGSLNLNHKVNQKKTILPEENMTKLSSVGKGRKHPIIPPGWEGERGGGGGDPNSGFLEGGDYLFYGRRRGYGRKKGRELQFLAKNWQKTK